jgi:hypothetical protein
VLRDAQRDQSPSCRARARSVEPGPRSHLCEPNRAMVQQQLLQRLRTLLFQRVALIMHND